MARQRQHLFTIGYSGYTVDSFISALQRENVTLLLDIRWTPISRKKGFSKTALRLALTDAGIRYHHLRVLGSPTELRQALYAEKDLQAFFASYRDYLNSQQSGLREAADLVTEHSVCLMCVEQCADECHRSVVAEAIKTLGRHTIQVRHLPAPMITPQTV